MRVACSPRDVVSLVGFLRQRRGVELVQLTASEMHHSRLPAVLTKKKVNVYVQIAPQWEWGRHLQSVSRQIMDIGVKLLSGEGAMFRWLGSQERAGSEIGFYLAPWGYSGNSKLSRELPSHSDADMAMARILCSSVPRWQPRSEKILVMGQQSADRARYFRGPTTSDQDLLAKAFNLWGADQVVYRPHPLDVPQHLVDCEVLLPNIPLYRIVKDYAAVLSANSTSTIEAICCGVPVMNDGVGPWSGSPVVQRMRHDFTTWSYQAHVETVAALVSLHRLPSYGFGDPLGKALEFYSPYSPDCFQYPFAVLGDEPEPWAGSYYWNTGKGKLDD